MKVGDLVWTVRESVRDMWGIGYVIEVHESEYHLHIPFVTIIWPKWNMETMGSQVYYEVINE